MLLRHLSVNQAGIDGVREQDDIARSLHGFREIAIRPLGRVVLAHERVGRLTFPLPEPDVDSDRLRRAAVQVVDEQRRDGAGPWPAAGDFLELANRRVVDLDEDDVLACFGRSLAEGPHPPVVGLELGDVEPAGPRNQPHERGGADPDRESSQQFAHGLKDRVDRRGRQCAASRFRAQGSGLRAQARYAAAARRSPEALIISLTAIVAASSTPVTSTGCGANGVARTSAATIGPNARVLA